MMPAYRLHLTRGGTVDVEAPSENAAAAGYMVSRVEELDVELTDAALEWLLEDPLLESRLRNGIRLELINRASARVDREIGSR